MNRSEELCKLLGIEPMIQNDYCYWECKDPKKQFKPCKKKSCEHFKSGYTSYPDLTKPSNFVKLLENIKIDGIELCDWLICYAGSFCNRQDFIDILVGLIEEYTNIIGGLTQDIKKIKQQAQQIEWEY